jgi:hypothetical protein
MAMGTEHKSKSDVCARCRDAGTIVMPTGQMYRICAPEKWKSYECAATQLVTVKKPADDADSPRVAKSLQRR